MSLTRQETAVRLTSSRVLGQANIDRTAQFIDGFVIRHPGKLRQRATWRNQTRHLLRSRPTYFFR